MKPHALAVFHRPPENLNCAQSVLAAHQTVTGLSVAPVADFKPYGGGRAPGGECGALYAACQCAPESAATLREGFCAQAGATLCKTLKRDLRFPCEGCVGLAAELLAEASRPIAPEQALSQTS